MAALSSKQCGSCGIWGYGGSNSHEGTWWNFTKHLPKGETDDSVRLTCLACPQCSERIYNEPGYAQSLIAALRAHKELTQ